MGNHEECKTSRFSPKRLLDVSSERVVLREGVTVSRYACLSHCWGPSQSPIRTLVETIDDFKNEIPWGSLSKTFQDAVETCRRLDIHHIWIDSLCIIQNSKDGTDWKEQSVQMADIYQNAFITIAATKSKDGLGGCFAERDAGHVDAHALAEGGIVYVRKEMPYVNTRDFNVKDLPLLSRGWVYQEMALSPRVVHFCRQEVLWRCRRGGRSESGSNDGGRRSNIPDITDWALRTAHIDRDWYDAVHNYTHLALTFHKDRLAAVAAVAKRTAKRSKNHGRYLAGLWEHTLLPDLLWQTHPPGSQYGPAARPAADGTSFPTWSWASVATRVQWFAVVMYGFPLRAVRSTQLLKTDVRLADSPSSPYLGVAYAAASLTFRGPLLAVSPAELARVVFMARTDDNSDDGAHGQEGAGGRVVQREFDDTIKVHEYAPDCVGPGADDPGPAGELYLLPLMIRLGGTYQTDALVLRRLRSSPDTYKRVGRATLNYTRGGSPRALPVTGSRHALLGCSETPDWVDEYLSSLEVHNVTIV